MSENKEGEREKKCVEEQRSGGNERLHDGQRLLRRKWRMRRMSQRAETALTRTGTGRAGVRWRRFESGPSRLQVGREVVSRLACRFDESSHILRLGSCGLFASSGVGLHATKLGHVRSERCLRLKHTAFLRAQRQTLGAKR